MAENVPKLYYLNGTKNLIFTAPTEKGLEKFKAEGFETRITDFNDPDLFSQTECNLSGLLTIPGVVTQVRHVTKLKTDKKGIE